MILETVLWWMPISDAMRFIAVPSVCAARIDATTAAGFVVVPAPTKAVRVRRNPPPHPNADLVWMQPAMRGPQVRISHLMRPDPHALSAVSEVTKQVRVR